MRLGKRGEKRWGEKGRKRYERKRGGELRNKNKKWGELKGIMEQQ